ncbi:MAG: histone deacetylase [Actinobacteria bacterium]|nr:histone deacetylase [Actinomycetota bacterium]
MGQTVIFYDPVFEKHMAGFDHPERPERIPVSMKALLDAGLLETAEVVSPRNATVDEIELVHPIEYIEKIRSISDMGGGHLDADTGISKATYMAAVKAAGALTASVDGCLEDKFDCSFCMVRPPGHHALPSRGMGFCIFNNVAIAARYATRMKGLERVMIFDWDAHHGNGTQDIFYEDDSVLYISIHQYPHYPGSGAVDEVGTGKGKGYTINFPFPPGTGEEHYMEALEKVIIPAGRKFKPDLVMISAGYDSHKDDLLCSMRLNDRSYKKMTDSLLDLAGEFGGGKLILTIEGGYNLRAMACSVVQTVSAMTGVEVPAHDEESPPTVYPDEAGEVISRAKRLNIEYQ